MTTKRQNKLELAQFFADLKSDLAAWVESTGTKQAVLGSMLGNDASQVSHAVRPSGSISENFIRRLSAAVPEFVDAYPRFYRLKYGDDLAIPAGHDEAVARSQRVARLRAAEEEVINAVRALTQVAIDLASRD